MNVWLYGVLKLKIQILLSHAQITSSQIVKNVVPAMNVRFFAIQAVPINMSMPQPAVVIAVIKSRDGISKFFRYAIESDHIAPTAQR